MKPRLKLYSLETAAKSGRWFRLLGMPNIWYCAEDESAQTFRRVNDTTAENTRGLLSIGCDGLFEFESDSQVPTEIERLYGSWRMRNIQDADKDNSRAFTILRFQDITTIQELVQKQEKELLRLKNFGTGCLTFTQRLLERYGLQFGMSAEASAMLSLAQCLERQNDEVPCL